jgi:hypothetical protein
MTPTRPLLCILVDAFRHDYLKPSYAPYLSGLAAGAGSRRIRPVLGYSDSIRATIFTGAYPDQHGYWMEYCLRPEQAPLAALKVLAPLDALPSDFIQRGTKFVLSNTVARAVAKRRGYAQLSLRHFPFRALGSFDWTLKVPMTAPGALGMPTLFDDLSAAGVPWRYLDSFTDGRRQVLDGLDDLPTDTGLAFVYLHHIDMASHSLGLTSPLFRAVVRRTDALVAEVVERTRRRLGDVDLVVFSDHGMSVIERSVDYSDLVRHPAFPDRFCFALDATMVRLWFFDDDVRLHEEVRERVSRGAPGHFLDRTELIDLHLDFSSRLYGDEIYLLEPRVAIFPNFHSLLRPKAMHAYHPSDSDQHGIFIAPPDERLPDPVELVEINALCKRRLGLATPSRPPAPILDGHAYA